MRNAIRRLSLPFNCFFYLPLILALCMALGFVTAAEAAPTQAGSLRIYSIDVEGGQSTLVVAPGGASLLIDAGWPGNGGRDADRIQAAMQDAGITKIDNLLVTHFHVDHVGGVPELAKRVPIEAPWAADQAERWDEETFATWIRRNTRTASARF